MKKYNATTGTIETINTLFPSFVVDGEKFDLLCTHAIAKFDLLKVERKIAKLEEDTKLTEEEKTEELEELENDQKEIMKLSGETDKISVAFVLAMDFASCSIGVEGFRDIYEKVLRYEVHVGSEKWGQDRKAEFTAIKTDCNSLLQEKFGKGDGKLYKGFVVEMNSKAVELFISATLGRVRRVSTGKKDARTYGLCLTHLKEERSYLELMKAMFEKYGCHIDKQKKIKYVDVVL